MGGERSRLCGQQKQRPGTETNNQGTTTFQKVTPGLNHVRLASAYFRIARNMRVCAKQRHKMLPKASRISGSEASGFTSRTAFAVRITPLRQNPHWAAPSSINACWIG